ncbi:hypothetical protein [Paenibacillus antarcticus]|uniref:Uncharacterized protein n=1 Tax=Paenibacillus antarcticus TaxID=253703 RepID=A0A168P4D7_9BACL|nr:hypothetical protein [Paenibacillus antarcticus]OAB46373.1 hypothetical protein PBAT_10095 [Paenibacillus antarcticus]
MTSIGKKSKTNKSSKNSKKSEPSIMDSLQGNNLEIIVAALLVTGKLRVDAVQLFRQATMIVSLVGQYNTLKKMDNSNVNNLIDFINNNGNLTLDELIQGIRGNTEG